jgi:hypothetical protein
VRRRSGKRVYNIDQLVIPAGIVVQEVVVRDRYFEKTDSLLKFTPLIGLRND